MFCGNCGNSIPAGNRFCPACGTSAGAQPAAPQQPPQAAVRPPNPPAPPVPAALPQRPFAPPYPAPAPPPFAAAAAPAFAPPSPYAPPPPPAFAPPQAGPPPQFAPPHPPPAFGPPPFAAPPGYPPPGFGPQAFAGAQPAYAVPGGLQTGPVPPNMHWALVMILSVITTGLAALIWSFREASFVKKIDRSSKAVAMMVLALLGMVAQVALFFVMARSVSVSEVETMSLVILALNVVILVRGWLQSSGCAVRW